MAGSGVMLEIALVMFIVRVLINDPLKDSTDDHGPIMHVLLQVCVRMHVGTVKEIVVMVKDTGKVVIQEPKTPMSKNQLIEMRAQSLRMNNQKKYTML